MTAQAVARDREECTTHTVAKQRDTDDHVREVMPLNDREEASQQHLEGEGPSRHQRHSQEGQHGSALLTAAGQWHEAYWKQLPSCHPPVVRVTLHQHEVLNREWRAD